METTTEIQENNLLIAQFMGAESPYHAGHFICHNGIATMPKDMKFNLSWDWLMPVVEKCMETDMHSEGIENLLNDMTSAFHNVDIEELYKAVVQFINWYNSNK